jgi:hypothetical protein
MSHMAEATQAAATPLQPWPARELAGPGLYRYYSNRLDSPRGSTPGVSDGPGYHNLCGGPLWSSIILQVRDLPQLVEELS